MQLIKDQGIFLWEKAVGRKEKKKKKIPLSYQGCNCLSYMYGSAMNSQKNPKAVKYSRNTYCSLIQSGS